MASSESDIKLTRVGPGTPMGNLMRQYWVPACLSSELVADGDPMRLMLLCERLIAFRDSDGRVGVMDHRCPHRGASLFFGRNEQSGIRCVYHGWKFATDGTCIDRPNLPAHLPPRVRAMAYPTAERGGIVYVYMGTAKEPPPLPAIESLMLPADRLGTWCTQRECNWLQALEGDIDTSHLGFLHLGSVDPDDVSPDSMHRFAVLNRAPEYYFKDTDWGTMYCAYRPAEPGNIYYRFSHFVFPFWTMFPDGDFNDNIVASAWVPMDDTHTMQIGTYLKGRTLALRTLKDGSPIPGLEADANFSRTEYLPNTADWFGRHRYARNKSNDYMIDREAQRHHSFTGIDSIPIQDMAMSESMGDIADRSIEHLVPSDIMVARTRRRMLAAMQALETDGTAPPLIDDPRASLRARSGSLIAADGLDWNDVYERALQSAFSPMGDLQPAE